MTLWAFKLIGVLRKSREIDATERRGVGGKKMPMRCEETYNETSARKGDRECGKETAQREATTRVSMLRKGRS